MTSTIPVTDISNLSVENQFAQLPSDFYTVLRPTPLAAPYLVGASSKAADAIGLSADALNTDLFTEIFTGNQLISGSTPLAAVYSGHQFGVWAGQLGDGRAILLGDVAAQNTADSPNGRIEIQLKGAGMTPYSRMGDGRAVLRSSIREFLCSEAMAGLGIPTSRALSVTGSDHYVMRETPETAAVVTRLAPSFIRFGSFEHWYYNNAPEQLQALADFVLGNYYPALLEHDNPYQALLQEVTQRTAKLMAQWQAVGFMHGVMNTDNMSILGITLDYGPFGFMEAFNAGHICNHTDTQGRYSYRMQPKIGHWNCHALAQALLPLIGTVEDTQAALSAYQPAYQQAFDLLLHQKFGLQQLTEHREADGKLFDQFFDLMQQNGADFTHSFRHLSYINTAKSALDEKLRDGFIDRSALDLWLEQYRQRLQTERSDDPARQRAMQSVNPKYILRNYLAQIAIEKAQKKDFSEVAKLLQILENPFDEQAEHDDYAALPPDWARELEVSCSS
ncbi:YdiU family protein [Undibacterium sp. Jales W-56]|uniref:protein adenylyltransferase SelO n=1 Tax=Undibacterium sp. Jales W-56 TaxID=2897325 RepID=UPI0021CF1967|nr:YdiU family protein [Undibacterium sp. Jales W-56]MCU6433236.1 YdiU family protein [Undibacterium sp. Jales W-56]